MKSKMSCGNCGQASFRIVRETENSGEIVKLHVICEKCGSSSIIGVSQPRVCIDWGKDSDGILCVMPGDEGKTE